MVIIAPVNLEGCGRRDALRSALAVLKEVRSAGAVLPPVRSQAWTAVRVPGTSRWSCFNVNDFLNDVFAMVCNTGLAFNPIRAQFIFGCHIELFNDPKKLSGNGHKTFYLDF